MNLSTTWPAIWKTSAPLQRNENRVPLVSPQEGQGAESADNIRLGKTEPVPLR
jgi:hypothetical protein